MKELRPSKIPVVLIDDDPLILDVLTDGLARPEIEIHTATSPIEGIELVRNLNAAIVVLDLNMPQMHGMEVLKQICDHNPAIDVYLLTGDYSPESAVKAIRAGAADYLTKPVDLSLLREKLAVSIEDVERRRTAARLDDDLARLASFCGIVGRSPMMVDLYSLIRRVAPHFRDVLVRGETGTGKELVARALHDLSPAAGKPFVPFNCAGLVESLAESQLFGYVRGAFTGANQDTPGIFEAAQGGTLFLDEVGELPLSIQSKLLRVLQQRQIQRVGSPTLRSVDVRIVAATNRDLRAMVKEKTFREDLYYRLAVFEIHLPSLRQRMDDLPLLLRHFLRQYSSEYGREIDGVTRRAEVALSRYSWPGNVRELQATVARACLLCDERYIDLKHLPNELLSQKNEALIEELMTFDELQKRHLVRVLERLGGNKQRAADILGVSRGTLYKMLRELEIEKVPDETSD
jgi:DNA-binding NtrC family response regulator